MEGKESYALARLSGDWNGFEVLIQKKTETEERENRIQKPKGGNPGKF